MADTSARMLRLLSLLQLHRHWPGTELAERLEVSERTVRRDIDRLRSLGYPVESLPGVAGGYQLSAGSSLPPMVFDHDEAIALALGLRDVAHGSDPSTAEASLRALAKLTAMLPDAVRHQLELVSSVTDARNPWERRSEMPDVGVLGAIAQACRDSVRLSFSYTAVDGSGSNRYVEPYRLVNLGRRWYLVAYDLDRSDWRTFRVDRSHEPVPSRNSFDPRELPSDDLPRYIQARIRELRPSVDVELVFHAPPAEVAAVLGRWATVTAGPTETTSRVHISTDNFDGPVIAIANVTASLDIDFAVVGPPEFAEYLAAITERMNHSVRPTTGPFTLLP
jgi:predicted DNA-binding transcriptional regulator YafY